jgi:hypothetical protein
MARVEKPTTAGRATMTVGPWMLPDPIMGAGEAEN